MGFSLLIHSIRELWKEWELRLLVLLSLFLQLTLATQVSRRKYKFRKWILIMIWMAYISADSITNLALSIFSNRLANINEMKGMIDPKSEITAFWAPFLLLHLGGPDTITAFVPEDNELWLRQLVRLCIQVGLVGFIYYMALLGSTLWMLAAGMILVGLMKYAERILCLYLASKGQLQDLMLSRPNFVPIYPSILEQYFLKEKEGYMVEIDEVCEVMPPEDFEVNSGQTSNKRNATTLVKAYKLFSVFKLIFLGLIRNSADLDASKRMFRTEMDSAMAFGIVEIELGFMYDLLHTKAPLLNCAWGISRWVISLSMLCAVLVFFSLQDKKDYPKIDICITFLLISVAMLIEIYSLLLAISSDWVNHWQLQRPGRSVISSAMAFLQFCPNQRWSNSVAQISLLELSIRKINRIFLKYPMLTKLDEKLVILHIDYEEFNRNFKGWIFGHTKATIDDLEYRSKRGLNFTKLASRVLKKSNNGHLIWSVDGMEFDQSILIWHIATELCSNADHDKMLGKSGEDVTVYKMSKVVSRYMLYLLVLHPSMLPTGIGMLRYRDTLVDARKFFEGKRAKISKNEGNVSSVIKKWVKKEEHFHTGLKSCEKGHKSRESRDLCEQCHLLLQVRTDIRRRVRRGKRRSVLLDACRLASQLNDIESYSMVPKWHLIGKVWAMFLIYAACQCKGPEHLQSLSRGGELLSHIWLLMAHLGVAEAVQTFEPQAAAKLFKN